jgi:hypothetical protein
MVVIGSNVEGWLTVPDRAAAAGAPSNVLFVAVTLRGGDGARHESPPGFSEVLLGRVAPAQLAVLLALLLREQPAIGAATEPADTEKESARGGLSGGAS